MGLAGAALRGSTSRETFACPSRSARSISLPSRKPRRRTTNETSPSEAQEAIGREVATALTRFVNSGATAAAVNFPQVDQPIARGAHRILNVHRNVPGVLRDINRIVSDLNANIGGQVLATDANIGYLVMDLDKDVSDEVSRRIAALETNIRTRILY